MTSVYGLSTPKIGTLLNVFRCSHCTIYINIILHFDLRFKRLSHCCKLHPHLDPESICLSGVRSKCFLFIIPMTTCVNIQEGRKFTLRQPTPPCVLFYHNDKLPLPYQPPTQHKPPVLPASLRQSFPHTVYQVCNYMVYIKN